jgi:hypothetical protein
VLSKSGEDWSGSDGKKYEKSSAEDVVSKLRSLSATEFADSGFGTSAMDITVTSSDGKHVEKVALSKGAKNVLARRENETSLYALESSTIDELQKVLATLK